MMHVWCKQFSNIELLHQIIHLHQRINTIVYTNLSTIEQAKHKSNSDGLLTHQKGFSYMRSPWYEHRVGSLWTLLLKPKTGSDKWYEIHKQVLLETSHRDISTKSNTIVLTIVSTTNQSDFNVLNDSIDIEFGLFSDG